MPDANGWIKTLEREPTDDEIEAGIEVWKYHWAGRQRYPDFCSRRQFKKDFRALKYDAWRPFIPPEREHAKCVCGRDGEISSYPYGVTRTWRVKCQNSTCWIGPLKATEREVWDAWDALMGKAKT